MPASARRIRSWFLLTACTVVVGAFWTEAEARACSESSPVRSCCVSKSDPACCCQAPVEARSDSTSSSRPAASTASLLAGRSSCGCVMDESIPADRPSRPSGSTSESESRGAAAVAVLPAQAADALARALTNHRTTPFDPLGAAVLLRTSRLRF